ncbi:hypothetical protein [Pseudobutyrivibrio xylanivorans]|uniref:Uncharacterized protein n=1 Tax=Pseudobutyrivibrio xylanivorans DSM 14809 TaxID=1123012 RepID=A0A1M6KRN6_PSEXY|nr:hypothetical protein [Pseudobutyrivibrio xylanivorans]SHJ61619.1 hypothetical protein SAMN02745725_02929 [Pseudobutyrivibrio xylanivorans DSM 14809]
MKFNTIILCFIVWAIAGLLSVPVAVVRYLQEKREHNQKAIYLRQVLFLAENCKTTGEIVKDLYYFFINDRRMRKIMLRAMKLPDGKALDYIYSKIGCEPMKILHGFLIRREGQDRKKPLPAIPDDIIQYFNDLIEQWEYDYLEFQRRRKIRKLKTISEIMIFMILTYYFYRWLNTEISLWIFAAVNTLGVIIFILPTYKKTHSQVGMIQSMYQLVSGIGLIVNIFTVVSEWLGQVA